MEKERERKRGYVLSRGDGWRLCDRSLARSWTFLVREKRRVRGNERLVPLSSFSSAWKGGGEEGGFLSSSLSGSVCMQGVLEITPAVWSNGYSSGGKVSWDR